MNYGFIGAGNMASAIISGVLRSGGVHKDNLFIYDANPNTQRAAVEKFGVNACGNANALIKKTDVVFLAIKPTVFPAVLPLIKDDLRQKNVMLVSLAAGCSLASIEQTVGTSLCIMRVMPNLNAAVCESVNAICSNAHTSTEQQATVTAFLNKTGTTIEIEESAFSTFSAIAGCSPAFTYLYIDSLAKGAHKNGMNKQLALKIATQAVLGSAKMLLESDGTHPWALIDSVCSPGGTTIEGVCALEDNRFQATIVQAVDAAIKKDAAIASK